MIKTIEILYAIILVLLLPAMSFAATITSQADGNWHTGSTWVGGVVPNSGDDVIIEGHYVDLTSSDAYAKSLTIINTGSSDAVLDIHGNLTLAITGDMLVKATNNAFNTKLEIRQNSIVNVGGNMLMERTADNIQVNELLLVMFNSGQLHISGSFDYIYRNGTENSIEVDLYGSAIFTVGENSSVQQEGGNTFTFYVSGNALATFEKNFTLSNTGSLTTSMEVYSGGDLVIDSSLTLHSLADTYVSKLYISTNSTVNLNGDLIMTASADQTVKVVMDNTAKFYLAGNVSRPNNFGSLDMMSNSEFYFDGTSAQTVPKELMPAAGNDAFNYSNIIFQNSSDAGLTLDGDITVSKHMTLSDGVINTTSAALLIVDNLATIDPGNSASYVDGPMIKRGSTNGSSFTFPTGDNGIYAPITIDQISDTGLEYTAQYIGCPPPTISNLNNPLKALNSQGYWSLERSDAAAVGNVALHWDDADAKGINDLSSLVVSYYNPVSGWYSLGSGPTTGGIGPSVSGSLQNDSGCPPPTIAGLFALGSTEAGMNVLPVELISFRAFKNNDLSKVFLEWETASEENSDYFIIEKSIDGATFSEIGRVQAAQNSTSIQFYSAVDDDPNKGNNYYRIQQVDQNDIMNFSELVNIFMNEQTDQPVIYPNPVKDFVRVYSSSLDGQEVNVKVLDITGKCLYANPHLGQDGQIFLSTASMNIKNPGIYFINYEHNGQVYSLKFMKM